MRLFGALFALAATTGPGGCFGDGRENAHQPGHDLGAFHVDATVKANTCGEGALGETPSWQFSVHLSETPGVLYWNNGQAAIAGSLAEDGATFGFETSVIMNMRPADQVGLPPCSIERSDSSSGTLACGAVACAPITYETFDDVTSFTGDLAYTFAPTQGSVCDDLLSGAAPVVAALPCTMRYALAATHE